MNNSCVETQGLTKKHFINVGILDKYDVKLLFIFWKLIVFKVVPNWLADFAPKVLIANYMSISSN